MKVNENICSDTCISDAFFNRAVCKQILYPQTMSAFLVSGKSFQLKLAKDFLFLLLTAIVCKMKEETKRRSDRHQRVPIISLSPKRG